MAVVAEFDVIYGTGGGRDLTCDVFRPDGAPAPTAAAILLHGGGWRRGNRTNMHPRARALAERGILAVCAEYRLTDEARWPAHLQDVKACLRWLRSDAATWNVHPDRIALVGFSAGAHLALMAAGTAGDPAFTGEGGHPGTSEAVDAVAVFFPPIRVRPGAERDNGDEPYSAGDSLGDGITEAEARAASPIEYVRPGFPPTLTLHGTADEVVSCRTSQQLYDALLAAGSTAELRLYSGMRHEFVKIPEMGELAMADVALFLERVLVEPARFDVSQADLFAMPAGD